MFSLFIFSSVFPGRSADPICTYIGKVTVGLASHWQCVTDFSGLSAYGLTA